MCSKFVYREDAKKQDQLVKAAEASGADSIVQVVFFQRLILLILVWALSVSYCSNLQRLEV